MNISFLFLSFLFHLLASVILFSFFMLNCISYIKYISYIFYILRFFFSMKPFIALKVMVKVKLFRFPKFTSDHFYLCYEIRNMNIQLILYSNLHLVGERED